MSKALTISGWVLVVGFAGLGFAGCAGPAGDLCDAECGCELCSDRKYDMCKLDINGEIDVASAYDCGDAYQAYLDCRIARSACTNYNWHLQNNDCNAQRQDYNDCVDAASALDNNTTNPVTCQCVCDCTLQTGLTGQSCGTGIGCCDAVCTAQCLTTPNAGTFVSSAGSVCN
jgi:hypothetical protein